MGKILQLNQLDKGALPSDAYAIYGGSFDPPHVGHVSVVRAISEIFTSIVIAPCQSNPWKSTVVAPLKDRCEMLRLVFASERIAVTVSEFPYCYTEEFLEYAQRSYGSSIYWAIGADSAHSVKNWRNWEGMNLTVVVCPVTEAVHSTDVRLNNASPHPAVQDYITAHSLYQ